MNIVLRKLSGAFAALQRQGYWTLEGDICCQSCGIAMVPDAQADRYCFYHCQDEDTLEQTGNCYLSWDGDATLIIFELEAAGLRVEWNGSARTRIKVNDDPDVHCCSEEIPASDEHDTRVVMMRAVRNGLSNEAKAKKQ